MQLATQQQVPTRSKQVLALLRHWIPGREFTTTEVAAHLPGINSRNISAFFHNVNKRNHGELIRLVRVIQGPSGRPSYVWRLVNPKAQITVHHVSTPWRRPNTIKAKMPTVRQVINSLSLADKLLTIAAELEAGVVDLSKVPTEQLITELQKRVA